MSKAIVIETRPAPECHLSEQDREQFVDEMTQYLALFQPGCARNEQSERSQIYGRGLLGNTVPAQGAPAIERMALELGVKVRGQPHRCSLSTKQSLAQRWAKRMA